MAYVLEPLANDDLPGILEQIQKIWSIIRGINELRDAHRK
jgi:hypothetical protein